MNKRVFGRIFIMAGILGVSSMALADPYGNAGDYPGGYATYPPPGEAYAQVVSSTPVYQQISVAIPRQECYDQQVTYADPRPAVGATIIGGLAGGLLGHAFGAGSGRAWATGIGAVIGAGIGNNIARADGGEVRTGYQRQCAVVNDYQAQSQLAGYDVTYNYGGRLYRTHLAYDPGPQLLVHVNVAPAGY